MSYIPKTISEVVAEFFEQNDLPTRYPKRICMGYGRNRKVI